MHAIVCFRDSVEGAGQWKWLDQPQISSTKNNPEILICEENRFCELPPIHTTNRRIYHMDDQVSHEFSSAADNHASIPANNQNSMLSQNYESISSNTPYATL